MPLKEATVPGFHLDLTLENENRYKVTITITEAMRMPKGMTYFKNIPYRVGKLTPGQFADNLINANK